MILLTKTADSPETYSLHLDTQDPHEGQHVQARELLMRPEAVVALTVERVNSLLSPPKAAQTLPAGLESGPLP